MLGHNPTKLPPMPKASLDSDRFDHLGRSLFLFLVVLFGACTTSGDQGEEKSARPAPTSCNPIAAQWDCLLPYPSDFFLKSDESLPTGNRVHIPGIALPSTSHGALIDFHSEIPTDGFSFLPQITVHIPSDISSNDLSVSEADAESSTDPQSQTLILDTQNGEAIAHFVDISNSGGTPFPILFIRPLSPLKPNRRYIVILQGLHTPEGEELSPPEGFLALISGAKSNDPALELLRPHYEENIFPIIEEFGPTREKLILAWDFSTRSSENLMSDALIMREEIMAQLEENPPAVKILNTEEAPEEFVGRRVHGTVEVPLFLDHGEPGARMRRNEEGHPVAEGTIEVPFTIQIPDTVMDEGKAGRMVQFGHGFFQSRSEIQGDFLRNFGSVNRTVLIAADWWGLSDADMVPMLDVISKDPQEAIGFTDRIHQAFMNFIGLIYAARGPLLSEEALQVKGSPCYDPEQIYYYGLSMGHIFGGTYVALSPHIDRAILMSGGAGFSYITAYAQPFAAFKLILGNIVEGSAGPARFTALALSSLDRVDALSYASHILENTFEGSPDKRHILQQMGVGDVMVPNSASHLHARAMGLPLMQPNSRSVYGLEPSTAPVNSSALVEFDFRDPDTGEVSQDIDVHEATRRLPAAIEQSNMFLQEGGMIENTCSGPCDPE